MFRSVQTLILVTSLIATPALADAHKWEISEIFSNADGTVQFIEWFNSEDEEHLMTLETLSTASGSFYAFPNNLNSTDTTNRNLIMATAGFAAIPGMPAPDYIMPDGFVNPNGDTINYTGGDVVSFGPLPTDGRSSITRSGSPTLNSPRNFAGQSGSVRLAVAGTRNGSGANRGCYSSTLPVLGDMWLGTINGGPGTNVVAILGYESPTSGLSLAGGELLVDLASPNIFTLWTFADGAGSGTIMNPVPNDLSVLEFSLSTQGVVLGGGAYEFCNAIDLVLGH